MLSNFQSPANEFEYIFTPGLRSPLQEAIDTIGQPSASRHNDRRRIQIVDDENIVERRDKKDHESEDDVIKFFSSVDENIQTLYKEVDDYYLDTQNGILSTGHGIGVRFLELGESFMAKSDFTNADSMAGRVVGILSRVEADSLRVTTSLLITNFCYALEGVSDPFLATNFFMTFTYRYASRNEVSPNIFEWMRRFDDFVLKKTAPEGIEKIKVNDLTKLLEAYRSFKNEDFIKALNDSLAECPEKYSGLNHESQGHIGAVFFESCAIKIPLRMMQYAPNIVQNIRADLKLIKKRLEIIKFLLANPLSWNQNENKQGLLVTLLNFLQSSFIASPSKGDATRYVNQIKAMLNVNFEEANYCKLFKNVVDFLEVQRSAKNKALKVFSKEAEAKFTDDLFETTKQLLKETSLISELKVLARNKQDKGIDKLSEVCNNGLSEKREDAIQQESVVMPDQTEEVMSCASDNSEFSPTGSIDQDQASVEDNQVITPRNNGLISAMAEFSRASFKAKKPATKNVVAGQRDVFYKALLNISSGSKIVTEIIKLLRELSKFRQAYRSFWKVKRGDEAYQKYIVDNIVEPVSKIQRLLDKVDQLNAYYAILAVYKRHNWDKTFQVQIQYIMDDISNNVNANKAEDEFFPFWNLDSENFKNLQNRFSILSSGFSICKKTCVKILELLEDISKVSTNTLSVEAAQAYKTAYWLNIKSQIKMIAEQAVVWAACPQNDLPKYQCQEENPEGLKSFVTNISNWMDKFLSVFSKITACKNNHALLRFDADAMPLMKALQVEIREEAWAQSSNFLSLEDKLLALCVEHQDILHEALYKINDFASEEIHKHIRNLYESIARKEVISTPATTADLLYYFESQYQRSYRLSQKCITSFNTVSQRYLSGIVSSDGVVSCMYKLALFYYNLYDGILFSNYLAENPSLSQSKYDNVLQAMVKSLTQSSSNLAVIEGFVDSLIGRVKKSINERCSSKEYIDELEKLLYQYARFTVDEDNPLVVDTISLCRISDGGVTASWMENGQLREAHKPDFSVEKLSNLNANLAVDIKTICDSFGCAPLLNAKLRLLGDDWATFIALCVWMSALANTSLFSPGQLLYIRHKIATLLFNNTWVNSKFLDEEPLKEMQEIWSFYLSCAIDSQDAAQEYISLAELESSRKLLASMSALRKLRDAGDSLYATASDFNFLKKTIWLNAALDFYSKIKHVLKSNVLDEGEAEKNNKIMIRILELILGSANVPLQKKNEILDLVTNLFADEKMREYSLNSVLDQCSWTGSIESRDYIIESRVPAIIFSNSHIKLFSEDGFVETAQADLSTGRLQINDFLNKLYAGLNGVLELIKNADYHLFIPCLMKPLVTTFFIIIHQQKNVTDGELSVWRQCIDLLKNIAKKSGNYASSLNAFSGALQVVSLNESINFYYAVCLYIGWATLQKSCFKLDAAALIVNGFLNQDAGYGIDLAAAETLRYILKPSQIFSKNLSEQQQMLADFIKISMGEIKRFDDVLVIKVAHTSRNYLFYSSALSVDGAALILKEIYEMHLQNWHNPQSGSSMPMNYPVVFIYQPDSKKSEFKCIEIYENCHQDYNAIVRNDSSINASYLLARAARFVPEEVGGASYTAGSIEAILYNVKEKFTAENTVLALRFHDCVLSLVCEAMQAIRECYVGIKPITKAFLNSEDMYDDPRRLLYCSADTLIGFCIIACLCRHLREKRDVAYSQVAGLLSYLEDFFSAGKRVTVLGGSEGIVNSRILECAPAYLKPSDLLKIDSELCFGVDQASSEVRQQACVTWWFNSSPRENEASSESSVKARLKVWDMLSV